MDLTLFEQNYNNDKKGACAYSPKILLKIIMFCYSRGIISSRKIEKACEENITLKALAEDSEPDHDTIAAFIFENKEAVKSLFAQVLLQCSELKLITGEMFAIDGCKLPSNASKEWSGKIEELKKKRDKLEKYITRLLSRHQELDKDESVKKKQKPFHKTMGDDTERRERSIERLEKKLRKLDTFLETASPKIGISGEEIKSNITDNESAFIQSSHGYIQGYNGIAIADSGNQIIVSAEAIGFGSEGGCFPRMLDNLEENMKLVTGKENPLKKALIAGDTGYFSEDNLQEAAKRKLNVLIPDSQFRQRDPYFADKKKEKVKNNKKRFTVEDFKYDEKRDIYICPAGNELEYKCKVTLRNNTGKQYRAKGSVCACCHMSEYCISKRKPKKQSIEKCIKKRKVRGPCRALYIVDKKYENNLSEKMRKKIDDPAYRELYSRRMQIIEPAFSNIAYCKGMNRFTLRSKNKVNIQWQLYCMVHNIGKCTKPLIKKYAG
jgi:transposase